MKKNKCFVLFLTLFLVLGLIAGCSAAPNGNYVAGEDAGMDKEYSDELSGSTGQNSGSSGVVTDRKLIRRVTMKAETQDMDSLLTQLSQRVEELEGYVESREVQNGSAYSSGGSRYASLVIRIPAERLDDFVEKVSGVSNIVYTAEESDDVTLQYVATESRLKVLRAEEERLLEFLSKAQNVSEMLEIEERLTDVRGELETITSQLNTYDNLVDYGTVTLNITEVRQLTVVEEEEPTLWEQISTGFAESMENMTEAMRNLLVFFLTRLPYLIPAAAVAAVVLLIVKLSGRRKNRQHKDNTPQPPTAE